jgi:hypothetical protein
MKQKTEFSILIALALERYLKTSSEKRAQAGIFLQKYPTFAIKDCFKFQLFQFLLKTGARFIISPISLLRT